MRAEEPSVTSWQIRQLEMEEWYHHLAKDPQAAAGALRSEYQPYFGILSTATGVILDVGGGAGFAGAYLRPETEYIVIDPSTSWRAVEWASISRRLSTGGATPMFVRGIGEVLPFGANTFDAAFAFWSLNHAVDPQQCLAEIHRVLKTNGMALLVLEDMEPTWLDTLKRAWRSMRRRLGLRIQYPMHWHQGEAQTVQKTIQYKLSGKPWPLQRDHLRITDNNLRRWLRGRFTVVDRSWEGGFLSYELVSQPRRRYGPRM
jgi:SAM-dependent methyltransferase